MSADRIAASFRAELGCSRTVGLATVWLAGRVAVCLSATIGSFLAALIDISFLMLVAAICAREVLAGHNWRNLPIIAILVVLIGGNAAFHAEHMLMGTADLGVRIGIAGSLVLIMFI